MRNSKGMYPIENVNEPVDSSHQKDVGIKFLDHPENKPTNVSMEQIMPQ